MNAPVVSKIRAFSLIEVMVAVVITTVGLTAVYVLSSQCLQMTMGSLRANEANLIVQEQMERIKGSSFGSLLSSGSLSSFLSSNPLITGSNMNTASNLTDTVSISSYLVSGTMATSGTIKVANSISSNGSQAISVQSAGSLNSATTTVRVEVSLGWLEKSGSHSRSQTTLISTYD